MSPAPPFSWHAALAALRHPGKPPPALPTTALAVLVPCLVVIVVLVHLGHAWHDDPHRYFRERKAGTYLSFLNLAGSGVVAHLVGGRLRGSPDTRFWRIAAAGFAWLACDDLFVLHEQIDRGVHALLGLDPDDPVTDHLDDLIVAGYGVAAAPLAWRHRGHLVGFRWTLVCLALGFVLFSGMVVCDVLYLSKTVEDVLKVLAGSLILVGFLAARLEVDSHGGEP